jgi:hypothetical protein
MVRILLPPAVSLLRTAGEGARPELGQTFKLTPDQGVSRSRRPCSVQLEPCFFHIARLPSAGSSHHP